jgi:hypothetical protein
MKNTVKILVGGAAMVQLGSTRRTADTDYLICDPTSSEIVIQDEANNTDYLNAAALPFFADILAIEAGNEVASPQSMFEMKGRAFVQHAQNGNWNKLNSTIYDLTFLIINFNLSEVKVISKYLHPGELKELNKEIATIRKKYEMDVTA